MNAARPQPITDAESDVILPARGEAPEHFDLNRVV